MTGTGTKIQIRKMILTVCNDFCWQTAKEILASVEYLDDRADDWSLQSTICLLLRKGIIEARVSKVYGGTTVGKQAWEYRKVGHVRQPGHLASLSHFLARHQSEPGRFLSRRARTKVAPASPAPDAHP